ncbi:hypothetical protein Tco_0593863 [Tanacetum coccineum]
MKTKIGCKIRAEQHKYGDEREQIQADRENSSKHSRFRQTNADNSDSGRQNICRFRQTDAGRAYSDRHVRIKAQSDAKPDETKQNRGKSEYVVDAEMLHITTQDIVSLVKTRTSPTPTTMQNQVNHQ